MFFAHREITCDFPGCGERFDTTDGACVAAIRDGEIVAFCRVHSAHLLQLGVHLRTIEFVRAEYASLHGIPRELSAKELRARQEQDFISSIK